MGANVGQFAVASAKLFSGATIYSFEPVPACLSRLQKNVARLGQVRTCGVAVGERAEQVILNLNACTQASSLLQLSSMHAETFHDSRVVRRMPVSVVTLDSIVARLDLVAPVLLKIDVQGYEDRVLRGAIEALEVVDYVLMEVSFSPLYEGEASFTTLMDVMRQRGLDFVRPMNWLHSPVDGQILQMDALFAKRRSRDEEWTDC